MLVVLLSVAGGVGAATRLVVDGLVRSRAGTRFPYGTVAINAGGSLLIGIVTGMMLFDGAPNGLRLVIGTGFCGGYTTFSTASFETVRLLQERRARAAALNTGGTMILTLAFAGLGLWLTAA